MALICSKLLELLLAWYFILFILKVFEAGLINPKLLVDYQPFDLTGAHPPTAACAVAQFMSAWVAS